MDRLLKEEERKVKQSMLELVSTDIVYGSVSEYLRSSSLSLDLHLWLAALSNLNIFTSDLIFFYTIASLQTEDKIEKIVFFSSGKSNEHKMKYGGKIIYY